MSYVREARIKLATSAKQDDNKRGGVKPNRRAPAIRRATDTTNPLMSGTSGTQSDLLNEIHQPVGKRKRQRVSLAAKNALGMPHTQTGNANPANQAPPVSQGAELAELLNESSRGSFLRTFIR